MTESGFVKEGYCWQALDKARCENWDKNKSCKRHKARRTIECVYVLSAVLMTAKNLLRIFPKGSKLKKNTNLTLANDLTSLDCSSQSQSRMTEHSLLSFSPARPSFLFCFLFFSSFPLYRWVSWSDSWQYFSVTESAAQLQVRGQHRACLFFCCCVVP